jgi:hypothetical protein
MKYIKQYETKITQKSLLEVISNFLNKALPNNFSIKLYQDTINIKDTNCNREEIIHFSPNREDLEVILSANKYNL